MTAISVAGMGLTGVLRITWVRDDLAHVLDHSHSDETSGTWTGLACPGHGLALGGDVDDAVLRHLAAGSEIADLTWEAPDELAAEHAQVFQDAMRAHHTDESERAFEHHTSPHGLPRPHIHNIAVARLTKAALPHSPLQEVQVARLSGPTCGTFG